MRPTSKSGILGVFMSAALGLSCSLVDLRLNAESDCTSQPATFCTRLNDSQPPSNACQSWTCNKATRFCELGPRDLDADGAIDPDCAPSGSTLPLDCDDNDPKRFPNNPEVCDFLDNDCNSLTDENVYTVFDELTNDPQSFIPDTCPDGAITCTEGEQLPESGTISSNGLAFASRPEPNDPQVLSAFIRPVEGKGLLGAALFDTEAWDYLSSADLEPEFQPDASQPKTLFNDLNASSVSVTSLQNYFAIDALGKKTNDEPDTARKMNGVIAFEVPPKAHIEKNDLDSTIAVGSLSAMSGMGEQVLTVRMNTPSSHPTLQLDFLAYLEPDSGCAANIDDAPCLKSDDSDSIAIQTAQVPAIASIENFGWLVAIVGDDGLVIHRVQANDAHILSISENSLLASDALPDETFSDMALATGARQNTNHQLALTYVSNNRAVVHLLTLDTSTSSPTLSIAHTLDLSSMPGGTHALPQVVWHPLRDEWILGVLETSADPARLFVTRFTQDGTLLDEEAIQVFESRNLLEHIGFHFKSISEGFAILGYQLAGDRGNLIASKFGCSGP